MASLATLLISLIVGCIAVEGLRFEPPNLNTRGKLFSGGSSPMLNDPRCKEDGIFANPSDCTSYYVCKEGTSQDRQCPEGFKFDSIKHCTLDDDADCGKSSSPDAPPQSDVICPDDYGYFPDPRDCHKYIICTDGRPKFELCPDNQYYMNYVGCMDGRRCPQSSSNICKRPDGQFAIPGECRKYIKCVNSHPRIKECPRGLGFDHKKERCVQIESAVCKSNEIHDIVN